MGKHNKIHASAELQKERTLDQFYTNQDIVVCCLDFLEAIVGKDGLEVHDLWIEPSAGTGAFLEHLPCPRLGIDLDPKHPEIIQGDFLSWECPGDIESPIVVGNPPFGRNANLALAFFNHAARFAKRIALIVPRTFEKESLKRRLDAAFHLQGERVLPGESFSFQGQPYTVPTVFQVWERRETARRSVSGPTTHPDFVFCKREEADFAIQRVGVRAGAVKPDFSKVADASHYFVKAVSMSPEDLAGIFERIDYTGVKYSTAGNPSVSKRELIALYEKTSEA